MNKDNIENKEESVDKTEFIVNDANIKRVAALAISGMSQNKISITLGVSRRQIRNVYEDERFKSIVEDIGDDAILTAKTRLRQEISKMSDLMLAALRINLEKNSLEAVKVGLKVVGLDEPDQEQTNNNGLTVIMANHKDPEKVIEVKPKKLGSVN